MKEKHFYALLVFGGFVFVAYMIAFRKNHVTNDVLPKKDQFLDSISNVRTTDSVLKAVYNRAMFDTVGIYNAPIKIISSEVEKYGRIKIVYKNISNKDISAIRFKFYCENAFFEPANINMLQTENTKGFWAGFYDDGIKKGETSTSIFNTEIHSDAKTVLTWPSLVAFSDKTKWKSNTVVETYDK